MKAILTSMFISMVSGFTFSQNMNFTVGVYEIYDTNDVLIHREEIKCDIDIFNDESINSIGMIDNENINEPISIVPYDYKEKGLNDVLIFYVDGGYITFYSDHLRQEFFNDETNQKEVYTYSKP